MTHDGIESTLQFRHQLGGYALGFIWLMMVFSNGLFLTALKLLGSMKVKELFE